MAKKVYDLLLDENLDLACVNGDFVFGESSKQHQELLLIAQKGEFKEFPLVGVGISDFLNEDADTSELIQIISKEFSVDGMNVTDVIINGDQIKINAEYR